MTLLGVCIPPLGVALAIVLLWNALVGWTDLVVLALMYLVSALGITVGFHRLLTHRSFDTYPFVRRVFAVLGSLAVQGAVIAWVADHRKHHTFADEEGDPHSPHVGSTGVRGLWHAHVGWLFRDQGCADWRRYARDLVSDPGMRAITRAFPLIALASLALPALLGFVLTGSAFAALTGFLWGGLVRIFLVHHVTWSINSICHLFGRRRFATDDRSGNVAWLALPTLGESWHHNHHAFPRSASHGLRWWELDPSGLVIRLLERLGLAWNVVRVPRDRQAELLAAEAS